MKFSIHLLTLVYNNRFSSAAEIITMLVQISWQSIKPPAGAAVSLQHLFFTVYARKLVDGTCCQLHLLGRASAQPWRSVAHHHNDECRWADREICSPGCTARVIDWTWVCGKTIYRSRWVSVVMNICPAVGYKYYVHMYNTVTGAISTNIWV